MNQSPVPSCRLSTASFQSVDGSGGASHSLILASTKDRHCVTLESVRGVMTYPGHAEPFANPCGSVQCFYQLQIFFVGSENARQDMAYFASQSQEFVGLSLDLLS